MPDTSDLRLALLELSYLVNKLLQSYRARPQAQVLDEIDPELERLLAVGRLTLDHASTVFLLLDHKAPTLDHAPPIYAPSSTMLERLAFRRGRATLAPRPSGPRP